MSPRPKNQQNSPSFNPLGMSFYPPVSGSITPNIGGSITAVSDNMDWVRATLNEARVPANWEASGIGPVTSGGPILTAPRLYEVKRDHSADEALLVNHKFIKEVRQLLNQYITRTREPEPNVKGGKHATRTNTPSDLREDAKKRIQDLLKNPAAGVSGTCHTLGAWISHLMDQPVRSALLDAKSILRYLSSLTSGFVNFGYQLDLADLDADEITDFYSRVLDPGSFDDKSVNNAGPSGKQRQSTSQGKEKAKPDDGISDTEDDLPYADHGRKSRPNGEYVLDCLKRFHSFAAKRFGLEDPDWSELGEGLFGSVARPGFITEREYLHAARILCPDPASSPIDSVRDAFVLLLTYRFGLRGSEAISIGHHHWVAVGDVIVVLVTGEFNKLKTINARRQVPLLEKLSDFEETITKRWLEYWAMETNSDLTIPLFFEDKTKPHPVAMAPIRHRLIAALRISTLAAHINLHHARHSFGNRMALLINVPSDVTFWSEQVPNRNGQCVHARRLTLTTENSTRRSGWALARLMGHARPSTTWESYVHFLDEWSAVLVKRLAPDDHVNPEETVVAGAFNLDQWVETSHYLTPSDAAPAQLPETVPITPARALEFLRLKANLWPAINCSRHLNLDPHDGVFIDQVLLEVSTKVHRSSVQDEAVNAM